MNYLISIFLVFFTTIALNAQNWTLENCVNHAIENNIQLKQAELNLRYNKNALLQSKLQILPNLNLSANQNYSFGRSLDPYTYDFADQDVTSSSYSANSSINLFNGFQTINSIRQSNLNLLSGVQDVEKLKNDIALNIAASFLQVLYSEELYEIAKIQSQTTDLQVERTRKLVEAGSLAKGSLLEVEALLANEKLQEINSQNQLLSSYLNLKQILDLDTVTDFKIVKPTTSEIPEKNYFPSVDQVYSEAINSLPQIKSAELQARSNEIGVYIAQGKRSPRLFLTGSYGTGYSSARMLGKYLPTVSNIGYTESGENVYAPSFIYNSEKYPFNDQIKDNASTSLAFSLQIPIFNNFTVNTAVSNSKIAYQNSLLNLENSKKQLFKEIQQAHSDATAAYNKYLASKKAFESNEESFKYTQEKFNVGMVSSLDYNIAKTNLSKAKSDMLQSKYDLIFKTKILDFYRGNQIKL